MGVGPSLRTGTGRGRSRSRATARRAHRQSPRNAARGPETALRARGVAGVLAESAIPARLYDLATSRRLLLAARTGGAAGLFLPATLAGRAERMSSAATARFEIARARSHAVPFGRARLPMPGRPAFRVRLLKAPGGLSEAARSRERWETGVTGVPFNEAFHAFSLDPSPLPADRPAAPVRHGDPGSGQWRRLA